MAAGATVMAAAATGMVAEVAATAVVTVAVTAAVASALGLAAAVAEAAVAAVATIEAATGVGLTECGPGAVTPTVTSRSRQRATARITLSRLLLICNWDFGAGACDGSTQWAR